MKVVLETERLLLRQFVEADAEPLLLMEREPDVLRYVGRKPLADIDAYRNKIRSTFLTYYDRPGGFGAWAIIEKMSAEFVGGCTLRPGLDSNHAAEMGCNSDEVELGYGLRKPSWGRGYATEVAQALVQRAFTELGAISLVACVTIDNVASVRVLEKAGLRRAGEPFCLPGESELSVKYRLTKDLFHSQREGAGNVFADLPKNLPNELFTTLLEAANVRIERIVSHGHASPKGFWYDQDWHEWVVVLQGAAKLRFEHGTVEMSPGDFLNIPAHKQHRVEWTTPDEPTIWLAVHYEPLHQTH